MADEFQSFGPQDGVLVICGVPIENLSDAGIDIEYLKDFSTGRTGINGKGIKVSTTTLPMRVTINLLPGYEEKVTLLNLWKADAFDGESFYQQIGASEAIYFYGPLFKGVGTRKRKVQTAEEVSDDVITIEFMNSKEL